jgi:UPF0755 protein
MDEHVHDAESATRPAADTHLTRRGKLVVTLVVLFVLGSALLLGGEIYLHSVGYFGASAPGPAVQVTIPKGASASQIGAILVSKGVIKSSFGFRLAAYLKGGAEKIEAGTYVLHKGLTAPDALSALQHTAAQQSFVTVTFPEGSWLKDFGTILERDTGISGHSFVSLATSGKVRSRYEPATVNTLEGLLFPSTYQVVGSDSAKSVLDRLVTEFEKQAATIDFSAAATQGYSPYQVITVASMVEAEAKVDADRPRIAEVIYNRLKAGMPLGIDATVDYAIGHHVTELTKSDLAIDSPYNTRLNAGLPPTPIGAPGLSSLKAAGNPAQGDLMYYVLADCSGHHAFASTYAQFLQDKAAYQALSC